MAEAMVRSRARQLLQMVIKKDNGIDEVRVLEIVRELLQSSIPEKRSIAREIGRQAQAQLEAQRAVVTTADQLDGPAIKDLTRIVRQKFPQVVDLVWHVDPNIIGGIVIEIGDMWYDASIANDLSKIKERLIL